MNVDEIIRDGAIAYEALRDSAKFINNIVKSFNQSGAQSINPTLRIKMRESVMEFESPLEIKKKFFDRGDLIELNLPPPSKMTVYSLMPPYNRLSDAYMISGEKVFLRKSSIEGLNGDVKISMEYPVNDVESLEGMVYTSSPKDSNSVNGTGEEIIDYWLHAQLKTVKALKEIYSEVYVEDVEVKIEVAVKEHIKDLFDEDLKTDLRMRTKLRSSDRNDRARAISYITKHTPKFKGDLDKVIYDVQELLRASHFRKFLVLKNGSFRLGDCERGMGIGDPIGPLSLPESMNVFSTTDLTLDDPAKNDNLLYSKERFRKKIEKAFKDAEELSKKKDRGY